MQHAKTRLKSEIFKIPLLNELTQLINAEYHAKNRISLSIIIFELRLFEISRYKTRKLEKSALLRHFITVRVKGWAFSKHQNSDIFSKFKKKK